MIISEMGRAIACSYLVRSWGLRWQQALTHIKGYEKREWLGCRKDSLPDAEYIELKSVKDHVWMWFNNECSGWIVDLSKCVRLVPRLP